MEDGERDGVGWSEGWKEGGREREQERQLKSLREGWEVYTLLLLSQGPSAITVKNLREQTSPQSKKKNRKHAASWEPRTGLS